MLDGGARAATINAIVAASGAPKGSVYHRFGTLDDLLAAMWVRAVRRSQAPFLAALAEIGDAREAAVAAGLSIFDFAVDEPADARLLASVRRTDLVEEIGNADLRGELAGINDALAGRLRALARALHGSAAIGAVEATTFCVVDLPQGAVRRHLVEARRPPRGLRAGLEAAIRAALAAA